MVIWAAAAALACAGYFLGIQLTSRSVEYERTEAPQPAQTGLPSLSIRSGGETPAGTPSLDSADPVRIDVPSLGIHATLLSLGLDADGAVAVPTPSQAAQPAWYNGSSTPGQAGPTVIVGHVDSRELPGHKAVFFSLGAAKKGDEVDILREDGITVVYTVDTATLLDKENFPSREVYGMTPAPTLRLITCGGDYHASAGGYSANVVVFGHYSGIRHAG
ncbi:class F sortase [Kitasatospora sp. NPDC048540]|uniref:class F sortase n=1 Tax=unclassified Kitasatospora TaxID=2633591 RepID=UPI000691A0C3|nr:class F sortase [Kitasatospora sp. MBT63]